jgi:hypothetical protein
VVRVNLVVEVAKQVAQEKDVKIYILVYNLAKIYYIFYIHKKNIYSIYKTMSARTRLGEYSEEGSTEEKEAEKETKSGPILPSGAAAAIGSALDDDDAREEYRQCEEDYEECREKCRGVRTDCRKRVKRTYGISRRRGGRRTGGRRGGRRTGGTRRGGRRTGGTRRGGRRGGRRTGGTRKH